jgi:2-amino-4-hydroxy-6-hydroxymethyldihydropteridine diphosphokinase
MEKIKTNKVLIALGSNLGDTKKNLKEAIFLIEKEIGSIERVSSFHSSTPEGFESDNQFTNACALFSTSLSPVDLLFELKKIEARMGRIKTKNTYEDRTIDLDIIFFADQIIQTDTLTIPHPHFKSREFVMKPLLEIIEENDVFHSFICL